MYDFNDFDINENFDLKDEFKHKIKVFLIKKKTEDEIKKYLFDESISIE